MLDKTRVKWVGLLLGMSGAFSAFADIARPITLYRLRRVGYEILNDGGPVVEEFTFWSKNTDTLFGIACFVFAVVLALSFRTVRLRVWGMAQKLLALWKRKFEYVVLELFVISAVVGGVCILKEQFSSSLLAMGYGKIYDTEPGWKYPDQIPSRIRRILTDRLNLVKDDLQKAVDDSGLLMEPASQPYWQVAMPHYAREKMSIMTKVLSDSEELRRRCRGIPIEWLVGNVRFRTREVPNNTIDCGITAPDPLGGAVGD